MPYICGMFDTIKSFLADNIGTPYADRIITAIILAGIALLSWAAYKLTRLILPFIEKCLEGSKPDWDEEIFNPRMLKAIAQLIPALIVNWLLPGFFGVKDSGIHWIGILTALYILGTYIYMVLIFADNLYNYVKTRPRYKIWAVRGLFQTIKVIAICIGVLICCSILFGRGPLAILTALGATAGIMMLVFKDTILGFVASVQLTVNKMLHIGDWIIAEKYGANGEVQEITLTTVKVKNWDNSISTIPPYSLISDSFRNYQPMRESGGRRVERSIYIDLNTVRFCSPDELARLRERGWLEGLDIADAAHTVNLHLLRKYLEHYLETHPDINHGMLTMVRQMAPTQSGLPLQLYFFVKTVEWKQFEHMQSDIFDHVYAIIAEFGLRMFQTPAGTDIHPTR